MVISSRKLFKADRYRYVVPIFKIQKNSLHFKFHNMTNDSFFSSLRIHDGSNAYDGFKIT